MNKKKDLELYIHIPFCISKCKYCDFLSGPATKERIESYFHDLKKEIENYGKQVKYSVEDYQVNTIFIGGGTPSSVASSYIREIMEHIE
ncbi:MAG: coproporphyrinogen III oxidase, partial [Acetivibrio sp.]